MSPFLQQLTSNKYFYFHSQRVIPWFISGMLIFFLLGLMGGLVFAPPDYQQGDAFRIIYVHVPSAVLSLAVYVIMAIAAVNYLIWKVKIADVILTVSVPLGMAFTALALITGSLWGRPMWGTWWIWDARLTSELVLFFLYLGNYALRQAIPDQQQAAKACAILACVGLIDVPIIHYSVYWWNTLHQQATVLKFAKPSIAPSMLYPLIAMLLAFFCYYGAVLMIAARAEILRREKNAAWVKELR